MRERPPNNQVLEYEYQDRDGQDIPDCTHEGIEEGLGVEKDLEKINAVFDAILNDHALGIALDQLCSRTRKLIG